MEDKCPCGETETIVHIFNCEILDTGETPTIEYENVYHGKLKDQIILF